MLASEFRKQQVKRLWLLVQRVRWSWTIRSLLDKSRSLELQTCRVGRGVSEGACGGTVGGLRGPADSLAPASGAEEGPTPEARLHRSRRLSGGQHKHPLDRRRWSSSEGRS